MRCRPRSCVSRRAMRRAISSRRSRLSGARTSNAPSAAGEYTFGVRLKHAVAVIESSSHLLLVPQNLCYERNWIQCGQTLNET